MPVSANPYSNTVINSSNFDTIESIDIMLKKTTHAFSSWKNRSVDERKAFFITFIQCMQKEKIQLAQQITFEMGKPIKESLSEIEKCIITTQWYIDNIDHLIDQKLLLINEPSTQSFVKFEPIGCVLGIMPWNFPYWQVFRFAIPTLLMGNTVLLKHAPNVQGCAKSLENIFRLASFPDDVFLSVFASTEDIENIIASPIVQAVTFTGSEKAGRTVAAIAGKYLKKCVMELGGSDAFIVLPDADLKKTIKEGVNARLQNNGQSCIAAKRFIIHTTCYDAFIKGLADEINTLHPGNPMLNTTDLGPMARTDLKDKLTKQVEQTIAAGANCYYKHPFNDSDSNFFSPIILENAPANSPARMDELFGPVFTCIKAMNESDAIRIANETSFGLGASIWTSDIKKGQDIASKIEAGSVFINGMTRSDARIPFGGIKNSGFGRELSVFGLQEFVNIKTYWIHSDTTIKQ